VIGDPGGGGEFYFLADLVLPGEGTPRISARLFDREGQPLLVLKWNRIVENPGKSTKRYIPDGFGISYASGEPLLEVRTKKFPNGYLTRIQGVLYDRAGSLRMEPTHDGIKIYGEAQLALEGPYPMT
jgi:hypothetical protein